MLRIAFALIGLAFVSSSAVADNAPKPKCESVDDLRKEALASKGSWEVLTPGQYHFAQGFFVASPPMGGVPPGDGAVVVIERGAPTALLLFTTAKGSMWCAATPIPYAVLDTLAKVPTVGALGADGQEM